MLPFVLHHLGIPVITNGFINSFYAISLSTGAFSLQRFLYRDASENILALILGLFCIHFIEFIVL
ncbi:MFS transporter, partial [Francisella tularensis subsp. holarctica]|nr:MFS transporter [Francisella tularensis subsp. holarctica]